MYLSAETEKRRNFAEIYTFHSCFFLLKLLNQLGCHISAVTRMKKGNYNLIFHVEEQLHKINKVNFNIYGVMTWKTSSSNTHLAQYLKE